MGSVVLSVALGLSLLVPRVFMDTNSVDPYLLRLSAVALLLAAITWFPRLRPWRLLAISFATIVVPYSGYLVAPTILAWRGITSPLVTYASSGVLQLLLTALGLVIAAKVGWPPGLRERLSLRRLLPWGVGLLLIVLSALIGIALPAVPLGRLAISPLLLAASWPAYVLGDGLQGIAQELAFRGLLMSELERTMSRRTANLVQAVFFALCHIAVQYAGPQDPLILVALVIGVVLGQLTQSLRSIIPAAAIHAFLDVIIDVVIVPGLYGG